MQIQGLIRNHQPNRKRDASIHAAKTKRTRDMLTEAKAYFKLRAEAFANDNEACLLIIDCTKFIMRLAIENAADSPKT